MPQKTSRGLNRELGLLQLVFYGTGTILGAGIFVVVGEVLAEAGPLTPFAYMLAALVAVTSALSFSEMAARVPTAAGPIDYVERAFGRRWLGSVTGWMLLIANTVSAATITTGFVAYMSSFMTVSHWIAVPVLIAILGGVAALGMKQSSWLMTCTTLIGMTTLLVVLWALRDTFADAPARLAGAVSDLAKGQTPAAETGLRGGWWGLYAGAFLAIYSFIGFGDMAQTAEETRDVKRTLPRAMILSLVIVFTFYLAVATALTGSRAITEIAAAPAPLVRAAGLAGWPEMPLAIASLFVIVNGALTQMIAAARLLMDIGQDNRGAPKFLGHVHKATDTPLYATAVVAASVAALALFVPLKQLASGTSLAILLVFFGVNAALIAFKRRGQPSDVPDTWRVVPWAGAAFTGLALTGQIALWLWPHVG